MEDVEGGGGVVEEPMLTALSAIVDDIDVVCSDATVLVTEVEGEAAVPVECISGTAPEEDVTTEELPLSMVVASGNPDGVMYAADESDCCPVVDEETLIPPVVVSTISVVVDGVDAVVTDVDILELAVVCIISVSEEEDVHMLPVDEVTDPVAATTEVELWVAEDAAECPTVPVLAELSILPVSEGCMVSAAVTPIPSGFPLVPESSDDPAAYVVPAMSPVVVLGTVVESSDADILVTAEDGSGGVELDVTDEGVVIMDGWGGVVIMGDSVVTSWPATKHWHM